MGADVIRSRRLCRLSAEQRPVDIQGQLRKNGAASHSEAARQYREKGMISMDNKDFLWQVGERLPRMRLIAEGAVARLEDGQTEGDALVFSDMAAALYLLRDDIEALQVAYAASDEPFTSCAVRF